MLWSLACDGKSDCPNARDETACTLEQFSQHKIESYNVHRDYICNNNGTVIAHDLVNGLFPDCLYCDDEYYLQNTYHDQPTNTTEQCLEKGMLVCIPGHPKCFPVQGLCHYDIDHHGNAMHCRNFAHLVNCEHFQCYYNIKMILEGIITRLRTDLGCLKPEMVV